LMLEFSGKMTEKLGFSAFGEYVSRVTHEWFNMRRALGAEPYDKRSSDQLIEEFKNKKEG